MDMFPAGKMELASRAFFPAVKAVLAAQGVVVLGTIPAPKEGRDLREVHDAL